LLPLADARMRISADDVLASVSLPPFPSSAMDGYAVNSAQFAGEPPYEVEVCGASYAGHPFTGTIGSESCIRIFTGAALPDGLDAVVIQEDCETLEHGIRIGVRIRPGDNVRNIGHDVAAGELIIKRGTPVTPFAIGWLAACGQTRLNVIARPTIAIFSTGDELCEPGSPLAPGQIYDSNRYVISALLASLPVKVVDLGSLPDDKVATNKALRAAARHADVLLTSGGVSVGDADFVTAVIRDIGELDFWRINIKPGKPLAYGRIGDCLFFGLPGNPVSSIVTFLLVARPAIMRLCGASEFNVTSHPAILADAIHHRPGREEYQRGTVSTGRDGTIVRVTGDQSSNRLATFSSANCLIRVPKDSGDLAEGTVVTVLPFFGLI